MERAQRSAYSSRPPITNKLPRLPFDRKLKGTIGRPATKRLRWGSSVIAPCPERVGSVARRHWQEIRQTATGSHQPRQPAMAAWRTLLPMLPEFSFVALPGTFVHVDGKYIPSAL